MFYVLLTTYLLMIVALVVCIRITNKGNTKHRMSIVRLIGLGAATAAIYTLFILVLGDQVRLATFLNGLYYTGTDWLAIALILFSVDYTRLQPPSKLPRVFLLAWAGIDTVAMLVNTFTQHDFTLTRVNGGWASYWQMQYTSLHMIHLVFVYLMVTYSVALLLARFVQAPHIYKAKYGTVLAFALSVVVLNMLCVMLDTEFDYSVLIYGLLAISICYYVLYASPKQLLESMHATLAEDSVIGLFVFDNDKQCVGMNKAAKELFGLQGDDYSVAEQYLLDWEERYNGSMKNSMSVEREVVSNGETVYVTVNYQNLLDEKGRVLGSGFQFENRTEIVKQYREEQYRATHDTLTGLLNRDAFEAEARKILDETDEPYCIVCTNIKDFKLINELSGTEVGDALLVAQAQLICQEEFGKSVSGRIYADKFITLLPKKHYDAEQFTTSMIEIMDHVLTIPFRSHFYSGIYEIVDKTESIWTMSDKAMMAIDSIRGSYEKYNSYYSDELFQRIMREKEIISNFEKAIEDGEFHMYLQPQFANDGSLAGTEALVRWIRPEKGMVSPGDFIPVLEKAGLIHKLDLYMWEKAAQKLEQWKKEGKGNISISVNISTKDFYLTDIAAAFRSIAEKYDFDIKNLKLEITESALMSDIKMIMQCMDDLHGLGYDIEIDDFGSGYSSLGRLKDIHADILKIDMIFLQETANRARSDTILKNVISMSKELDMPVITEGVETKEQVDFLQTVGCDMFQGFYFARPMSVEDFENQYAAG